VGVSDLVGVDRQAGQVNGVWWKGVVGKPTSSSLVWSSRRLNPVLTSRRQVSMMAKGKKGGDDGKGKGKGKGGAPGAAPAGEKEPKMKKLNTDVTGKDPAEIIENLKEKMSKTVENTREALGAIRLLSPSPPRPHYPVAFPFSSLENGGVGWVEIQTHAWKGEVSYVRFTVFGFRGFGQLTHGGGDGGEGR